MTLTETLERIGPRDEAAYEACLRRWDAVAKPLHSLGILEDLVARMAAVQGTPDPHARKRRVLVFCADNGVVVEGVSQSDSSVTAAVAAALADGTSNVNMMAGVAGADVETWDVGMLSDVEHSKLYRAKTAYGTGNLAREQAMSREQAVQAVEAGIHAVEKAVGEGCDILVTGEMGIGNTTSSSAVLSILLGLPPEQVTGRGSGLSDAGLRRKVNAIYSCIRVNQPDPGDPLDVLSKAGGFDIAAMCGVFLAGAALGAPVVMDGLISGAAALLAWRMAPESRKAMLPSHISGEPGGGVALEALGLRAPIHAGMALGEGTGGVALLPLLDMALTVYGGDHSFDAIGVEAYTPQGGEDGK